MSTHVKSEETKMADDNAPLTAEETEVDTSNENESVDSEDKVIPKSRLDSVIAQREEERRRADELEERLAELEGKLEERTTPATPATSDFTEEELRLLDRIGDGLRKKGFLTAEQQEEQSRIFERRSQISRLSDKYGKGSGYPSFNSDKVLVHAKKNGFGSNLEAAYKDMHWDAILDIEADKRSRGLNAVDSEKPSKGERPSLGVTPQDIDSMGLHEYESQREDLLSKFRKAVTGR